MPHTPGEDLEVLAGGVHEAQPGAVEHGGERGDVDRRWGRPPRCRPATTAAAAPGGRGRCARGGTRCRGRRPRPPPARRRARRSRRRCRSRRGCPCRWWRSTAPGLAPRPIDGQPGVDPGQRAAGDVHGVDALALGSARRPWRCGPRGRRSRRRCRRVGTSSMRSTTSPERDEMRARHVRLGELARPPDVDERRALGPAGRQLGHVDLRDRPSAGGYPCRRSVRGDGLRSDGVSASATDGHRGRRPRTAARSARGPAERADARRRRPPRAARAPPRRHDGVGPLVVAVDDRHGAERLGPAAQRRATSAATATALGREEVAGQHGDHLAAGRGAAR